MEIWGVTHQGMVRKQNQDTFAYRKLSDGRAIALVCDGMGGARAGNVASSMAVELFLSEFLRREDADALDYRDMERAADLANARVYQRSLSDPICAGMGTTLVAALAGPEIAAILNEGDSRCYLVREQGILRITRDHSLVEDLVERGELTREQARTHPNRNLITHALGAEPELHTDVFHQPLSPGDFLLLCSDGLSNVVSEQEILFEVLHGGPPESCCERLLEIALHRGAPDNVTVVLIQNS